MFRLYLDPFTQWLAAQGTKPGVYQPGAMMGAPPLGWEIGVGKSTVVYRVDPADPATLILVLIERVSSRAGLHSPFGDLIRFIKLIHHSQTGLTHVNGHINAVSWRPDDSLDTNRMKPFYVKHLGGHYFTDENGTEWVRGSIVEALRFLEHRWQPKPKHRQTSQPLRERLNSALELHRKGEIDEAMRIYETILEDDVQNHEALQWLAVAHAQKSDFVKALDLFARALRIRPDYVEAHRNRGVALHAISRFEEATHCFDQALALKADQAETQNNRGVSLKELGRMNEALDAFDEALKLRPGYANALKNRGTVLRMLKRPGEALADFDAALALTPHDAVLWNYRGHALRDLDRLEEALSSMDRAVELKPDYADAHYDRSLVLRSLMRHDEAIASCKCAIQLRSDHADAHWNLAELLILTGDYQQGWSHFEWRWRSPRYGRAMRELGKPMWLGQGDVAGKTLLVSLDGGFGDVIQFCRYVPQLMERGAKVILEAQAGLHSLLRESFKGLQLATYREPLPEFDLHCPVMSLPGAFASAVDQLPATLPYLHAPQAHVEKWAVKLGPRMRPRIGIVCSGSLDHANDRHRSISMAEMSAIVSDEAEFHCLQKEIRARDRAVFATLPIKAWEAELHDYADTAALVMQMDVVISVDTSVAHLAGALSKQVWVLLPNAPEMRWLLEREDCPWYPQVMRLFRQDAGREWAATIQRVRTEIAVFTKIARQV